MTYCIALTALVFTMLATLGCGLSNRSVETSGPTPQPTLETTPTPEPTPRPPATPLRLTPTPTRIAATPTPFVDPNVAYTRELYRGASFDSADEWIAKFEEWRSIRPTHPGILEGIKGLGAALRADQSVSGDSGIANDKWVHCVIGARIALETNLTTAEFFAWLKEYQDLVDGFKETTFDEADFKATVDGARQAVDTLCDDCSDTCEERWGNRKESWDGNVPRL